MVAALCVQICALAVFVATEDASGAGFWCASVMYGSSFGGVGALLPLLAMEAFGREHYGRIFGVIILGTLVPNLLAPTLAGMVCLRTQHATCTTHALVALSLSLSLASLASLSLVLSHTHILTNNACCPCTHKLSDPDNEMLTYSIL